MNREELERGLRILHGDARLDQTMDLIDAYVDSLDTHSGDLGTSEDVAKELGLPGSAHARSLLSRWGIERVDTRVHPTTGRIQALFDLKRIRAEVDRRGWTYLTNEERGRAKRW